MWDLEKRYRWTYLQSRHRDTCREHIHRHLFTHHGCERSLRLLCAELTLDLSVYTWCFLTRATLIPILPPATPAQPSSPPLTSSFANTLSSKGLKHRKSLVQLSVEFRFSLLFTWVCLSLFVTHSWPHTTLKKPFHSPGGSSHPGDRNWISYMAGRFFTIWATREAQRNYREGQMIYNQLI